MVLSLNLLEHIHTSNSKNSYIEGRVRIYNIFRSLNYQLEFLVELVSLTEFVTDPVVK